jgi:hypothetical protein
MSVVRRSAALLAVAAAALIVVGQTPAHAAAGGLRIDVLSNRADLISGGDALVEIAAPGNRRHPQLRVDVDGRDVTSAFTERSDGHLRGLVSGLALGKNVLTARLRNGPAAQITLINHPLEGPVISGPHLTPFICETEQSGLGPALDGDCTTPRRVEYLYKSTDGTFKPLSDPQHYPADVAQTTTTEGRTVPYVVRVETLTVNRSITRIAVLDDPRSRVPGATYQPTGGWNRKLVYNFGGGCSVSHAQGDVELSDVITGDTLISGADIAIGKGFANAVSSLNVLNNDCNDVISAETAMMVKEYFIDHYGPVIYTMGSGGSGGSIQQQMMANAYPGILDGLLPDFSFPDQTIILTDAFDCRLLDREFQSDPATWTADKQRAVVGFVGDACRTWDAAFGDQMAPSRNCPLVPPAQHYDPITNPDGVRCSIFDDMRNVFGTDPQTRYALRWYDNVGVQYGLKALNEGAISPDDFIALNASVGGYDREGALAPARSVADRSALRTAYRTGRLNQATNLGQVPILDVNVYWDNLTGAQAIHDRVRPFVTRARIQKATGSIANHVMWTYQTFLTIVFMPPGAFQVLDEWMSNIAADRSHAPARIKVVRDKPREAVDRCDLSPNGDDTAFAEPARYGEDSRCNRLFPPHSTPRHQAGEPLVRDALKCRLKPLSRSDYDVNFTGAQWRSLERAFPDGVCDYSKAAVEQQPTIPWMTFADGPGGRPLGPAPTSTPLRGRGHHA